MLSWKKKPAHAGLTLLCPGLFGQPRAWKGAYPQDTACPALESLVANAVCEPAGVRGYEGVLAAKMGIMEGDADVPAGALLQVPDSRTPEPDAFYLCASLVHLRVDM